MSPLHEMRNAEGSMSRAWYDASLAEFISENPDAILGRLSSNSDGALLQTQRAAWSQQIQILHSSIIGLSGGIFFEFNIPRMGSRADVVLIIGPVVFVIEFKVGESAFTNAAVEQVWDYALDLKNFHKASHEASIVPILIATEALGMSSFEFTCDQDKVYRPIPTNSKGIRKVIDSILSRVTGPVCDPVAWGTSSYHPTPTIVEAARALYSQHSVDSIMRNDAGAKNLRITSCRIEELVEKAQKDKQKIICFVTGVPGAGKTLVGLNVATQRRDAEQPTHAVFLSGNGPLVAVLREALARDEYARQKGVLETLTLEQMLHWKKAGGLVRKGKILESVKQFIQNVHHFRDEALIDKGPPDEHVVIFDEAQRAWNLEQTASFMRQKKEIGGFNQSEPEFLISYLDRHTDWAVIVCLVGGGQEINRGEAGISEWLEALRDSFSGWQMYISSRLTDSEYAAVEVLQQMGNSTQIHFDEAFHLSVSMRSFRAENVSEFVKALLDCERAKAQAALKAILDRYPIAVTRNLDAAKSWIRQKARGSERYGMVASSKAQRLKPHAVDIRVNIDPVYWFLNDRADTRSSYYLEDAATEFQVQGLELDWVCVTWDGDFRYTGSGWSFHDFRGTRWCNICNEQNQNYLRNAYRVLLTRARQGMVVFVPPGAAEDPTRHRAYYDSTFDYLVSLGIPEIR